MEVDLAAEFCLKPSNHALQSITSLLENKSRPVSARLHFENSESSDRVTKDPTRGNALERIKVWIFVRPCA